MRILQAAVISGLFILLAACGLADNPTSGASASPPIAAANEPTTGSTGGEASAEPVQSHAEGELVWAIRDGTNCKIPKESVGEVTGEDFDQAVNQNTLCAYGSSQQPESMVTISAFYGSETTLSQLNGAHRPLESLSEPGFKASSNRVGTQTFVLLYFEDRQIIVEVGVSNSDASKTKPQAIALAEWLKRHLPGLV